MKGAYEDDKYNGKMVRIRIFNRNRNEEFQRNTKSNLKRMCNGDGLELSAVKMKCKKKEKT